MDDVEDLTAPPPPRPPSSVVLPHRVRAPGDELSSVGASAGGPGSQSIFLKTYGCSHNISDSEHLLGLLTSYGYNIVSHMDDADCVVINSCTVKDPSEAAFINVVNKAKKAGKAVVVSGCVPQADSRHKALAGVSMLGTHQLANAVAVVEESLKGNTVRMLSQRGPLPSLDLPKIRRNPYVEIIPLSTGCLGNCTYCKTKHARGELGSYAPSAILARARQAEREGVLEVWLR